jgi:ABC-2 type transport system permease protein
VSTADTNFSAADQAATASVPSGVTIHKGRWLQVMLVLIRREFWEYRVLWMAPVAAAALLVLCAFLPSHFNVMEMHIDGNPDTSHINLAAIFALMQWGLTLPLYLVMLIVLNSYLVGCLFNERKERSILFWKSLPVSDGATVMSKFLVALVIVPLGVYLLAMVTNLLFFAIFAARNSLQHTDSAAAIWNTVAYFKIQLLMLLGVFVSMLWYAPLAAFMLLTSAAARRSPFLWATLPPVVAILLEKAAFGTHYLSSLLEYRTFGVAQIMHVDDVSKHMVTVAGQERVPSLTAFYDGLDVAQILANHDLWLGVVAAAGLLFVTTRIRRYRGDT